MIAVTTPWPNPPQIPPGGPTIFPAAVTPDAADVHPLYCACDACTNALLLRIARPLTAPGSLTDPALRSRTDSPTGQPTEGPIRSARSGAKLGAAGLGDLAAPTRGGGAA